MDLSTVAYLNNTFFKGKVSQKLDKTMEEPLQEHSEFKDFAFRMNHLPRIMRLIIVQINFSHKMKENFKDLVKERKEEEFSNCGPDKMLREKDTWWLSTSYRMIDRFLSFGMQKIMHVLRLNYGDFTESLADPENFKHIDKD